MSDVNTPSGRKLRLPTDPIIYFTFLLVVVGVLQWWTLEKTDKTLRLQQRAWIAPTGINLARLPEEGQGILFVVLSTQTGREPALHASLSIQNDTIESYDLKDANLSNIDVPENKSCGTKSRGDALLPPFSNAGTTTNSDQGEPRFVASSKILSKQRYYVVQGCWKYDTLGEEKSTEFCYIMQPVDEASSIIVPMMPVVGPIGPAISSPPAPVSPPDQKNAPKDKYMFVPCRSGFDAT